MDKKILSLILLSFLLISGYVPIAVAHNAPFPASYDATSAVVDTIAEPETLDPAWCYDTSSGGIIFNVYETVIFFDNVMTDGPYTAGKTNQFKPILATEWTWEAGPAPYVKTIYFKIRTGVTFHDGNPLTPADVEYSWERWMVQDRDGGPQWMFYYPVLATYGAIDPATDPNFGDKINDAIESNSTHAWIHLVNPISEITFLQIMSQPWAGVVEKAWAVAKGDFDGNWAAGWTTIYNTWHNPATSHIEGDMMGTGPYKFDYWVQGVAWSIVKYDNYWDGWPARVRRAPADTNERIGGFISRVTWNLLTSWATRRPRFLAGDADFTHVPRQYMNQVLGQVVGGEPIRCYYPLPMLALDAFFFTFDINPQSPYLGPGFDPANPYTIAQDRIPINLFSDWNVRRGFAAAFNYTLYLTSVYSGEATQPTGPWPTGLGYDNPSATTHTINLAAAETWLKAAWSGALWANGMSFTLTYNSGNIARETAANMIANTINSLNTEWEVGEPAIRDNNDNFLYDTSDEVLVGATPALGTVLSFPNDFERYADLNNNGEWDADEPAIRDQNNNGAYDAGDTVLSGVAPPIGTILSIPDDSEKFADVNTTTSKFHLNTQEVAWGSTYLPRMVARMLPLFFMGWQADYTDPDNFAYAFMHSQGTLARCQSFSDPRSDSLIEAGVLLPDDTMPYSGQLDFFPPIPYFNNYPGIPPDTRWPRRSIYYELQWWYYDYIPSVPIAQPVGRHWEQAWVRGWYYNPLYGGSLASAIDSTAPEAPVTYFYHIWKALTHFGDANNDGAVSILDGATISASWYPGPPMGPLGYKTQADLTGGTGGVAGGGVGPVPGIPDGKVNVLDAAFVSAYWDGPPKGRKHP